MLLALILAVGSAWGAAPEAVTPGSASAQALDLKGMNFIDGDTIKTIFAFLGMAVTGLFTYLKMKATMERKVDEAIQQTKTTIANDPLRIEQTSYQATMKKNDAEHTDLFNRMRLAEAALAEIKGTMNAKFEAISTQLMETKEMVRQLVDRICKSKK